MTTNPRECSDEELLELSRPSGGQRLLRTLGCPGMLALGYFASRSVSAPLMEQHAVMAWLSPVCSYHSIRPNITW